VGTHMGKFPVVDQCMLLAIGD